MKAAGIVAATLALAGCGSDGGGSPPPPPEPDPHLGQVFLQVSGECRGHGITQLWYCPCPPPAWPPPADAWIKMDLPDRGLEYHQIYDFGWFPIGTYLFLWRTDEDWNNRHEPIPPDLPEPPLKWKTWNSLACTYLDGFLSTDPLADKRDLYFLSLTCGD